MKVIKYFAEPTRWRLWFGAEGDAHMRISAQPHRFFSQFQQIAALADVLRPRRAELLHDAFRLMNMPAEKIAGLMFFDELAHSAAAGMQFFANAIEFRVQWRRVADQD